MLGLQKKRTFRQKAKSAALGFAAGTIIGGSLLFGVPKALKAQNSQLPQPAFEQKQVFLEKKLQQKPQFVSRILPPKKIQVFSEKSRVLISRDPNVVEPNLPASLIDAELKSRNSPAAGFGASFKKWGNHYSIKQEVALAFFRMESVFGTKGIAAKTKAIGNIRYTPPREGGINYTNYKGFRCYASWDDGIHDFFRLIASKRYARGSRTTLEQIVPVYAPESENNVEKYKATVISYINELYKKAADPNNIR